MKNERSGRKFAAVTLALAMLLGIAPVQMPDAHTGVGAITAEAAKKKTKKKKSKENPRLNKKYVSVRNNKTATVKVKGTKKRVSASSSDKSIATVKVSGKYNVKIRAAKKKKGVAIVRVKTSKGYRYVYVRVGNGSYASGKTKSWAQKGGFAVQGAGSSGTSASKTPASASSGSRKNGNSSGSYQGLQVVYYENKPTGEYARALELYNLKGEHKWTREECELLKKYNLLGGGALTAYEDMLDQEENADYYALVDSYKDYCKNYDKQILMSKCGMTAAELAHPDRLSDQRKYEILCHLNYYISENIPYIGGDPSKPHGSENDLFFYPDLWNALTEKGYVKSKKLGYGWSCNGTAYYMIRIARRYLDMGAYWVSMPEQTGNTMHGGAAVFLKDIKLTFSNDLGEQAFQGDTWIIYEPGYSMYKGVSYKGHWGEEEYTAPIVNDPNNSNYAVRRGSIYYQRCVESKAEDYGASAANDYPYDSNWVKSAD